MLRTSAGQLAVNEALPEDLRDYVRKIDGKSIRDLLQQVAEKYPDKYRDVVHDLSHVGYHTAYMTGGHSFDPKHLRYAASAAKAKQEIEQQVERIWSDKRLTDDQKEKAVVDYLLPMSKKIEDEIMKESVAENNPLAQQVVSGARGKPVNLKSLKGPDLLYVDHRDRPIPVPILKSYSQGLTPVEYYAGTFGARKGVLDTKFCASLYTPILYVDYSVKPIKDVKVGDMIMGADHSGRTRPVKVLAVYDHGIQKCYRYLFRKGSCHNEFLEIVCTEDHKILAQIKAGRPGSTYAYRSIYEPTKLPLKRALLQTNPTKNEYIAWVARGEYDAARTNEPRALLAGLMLGDGCMASSTKGKYSLSCADQELLDDVRDYVASFNLKLTRQCMTQYSYYLSEIIRSKRQTVLIGNQLTAIKGHLNETKRWLKETLGEKLAHEKTIPNGVWDWDDSSLGDFVGGIFSTDGCIEVRAGGVNIKLTLTSEQLVRELQRLLELRLGIWTGKIIKIPKEKKPHATHDQYCFSISHSEMVRRFYERVNLVGVKKRVLAAAMPFVGNDPAKTEFGCKIYSKEYVGELQTYDLEVDHPDHMFVLGNGLISENSVQDAGFTSKQYQQMTHRLLVTKVDHDEKEGREHLGLPVDTADPDNEGALLARPVGGYPRNTILTPKIISDLHSKGIPKILVRSPIVSGPPDGGLYARDVGVRERGGIAPVGDFVGISAAQALSEPLSQATLSSKHSGGVAGGTAKGVTGFKLINQLVQVPKTFKGGAAHAQVDGRVSSVEPAPQGGNYININGHKHYVGTGYGLSVKPGDVVEAGDILSEGIPNPSEIVKHKGIGEGRRYFSDVFRKAYSESGLPHHRRNIEILARGLIDHVRLNDEYGEYVPGDVVPYSRLEHYWKPREGHFITEPKRALNHYLEKPVLHYSIGTKIRPSVVKDLDHFGINQVVVHKEAPPFEPEMIRGMENLAHDPDWMTRFLGSYLQKNLLKGVHRGDVADESGTSYVPSLARAADFGKHTPIKPFHVPKDLPSPGT